MEERQNLERDLQRYAALLRMATDERAISAIKDLIWETLARLREINQLDEEDRA
jgi:hypothetical protein